MFCSLAKTIVGATLFASVLSAPAPSATQTATQTAPDGFPSPNSQQLLQIEQIAQGTLPNGPPPPPGALDANAIKNFQLINLNENFEVAYFRSLVNNITNGVSGFEINDPRGKDFVLKSLEAVLAVSSLILCLSCFRVLTLL
jgi:hypothetical protein